MIINTYVAGPVQANNYLVIDEKTKEAILIDCSDYIQNLVDYVKQNAINVKYILLTHGHFDHVLGVNAMKKALNAKAYIDEADKAQVEHTREIMMLFGLPTEGVENPVLDGTLQDLDDIKLGNKEIKIIDTPGHTSGCVCYLIEDVLFSGDTLFQGSYGRTDLPDGDFKEISYSIKEVLFKLNDNGNISEKQTGLFGNIYT